MYQSISIVYAVHNLKHIGQTALAVSIRASGHGPSVLYLSIEPHLLLPNDKMQRNTSGCARMKIMELESMHIKESHAVLEVSHVTKLYLSKQTNAAA